MSTSRNPASRVASDPEHRPLIAIMSAVTGKELLVKEGSLTAPWHRLLSNANGAVVATGSKHDPLIAAEAGEMLVKEGSLTAKWHREHRRGHLIALGSDAVHGALLAVLTTNAKVLAKQGALTSRWLGLRGNLFQLDAAG